MIEARHPVGNRTNAQESFESGQGTAEKSWPVDWIVCGAAVAGVAFEMRPLMMRYCNQSQLDLLATKLTEGGFDEIPIPECGSVLWVAYKRICGQDIFRFIERMIEDPRSLRHKAVAYLNRERGLDVRPRRFWTDQPNPASAPHERVEESTH